MDRNSITGLVLIALLIITWSVFFAPKPQPKHDAPLPTLSDTLAPPPAHIAAADTAKAKADSSALRKSQFGAFAPVASGKDSLLQVQTDVLTLELNTHGGGLQPIILNKFKTYDQQPLPIFSKTRDNQLSVQFVHNGRPIDTKDLYFKPSIGKSITVSGKAETRVTMRAEVEPGKYLEQEYRFTGNKYDVGYTFKAVGLQELITNNHYYLHAALTVPRTEQNAARQNQVTTVLYENDEGIESLKPTSKDKQEQTSPGSSKWVSFKSQFFTNAIIANRPFESVSVRSVSFEEQGFQPGLKHLEADAAIPYNKTALDSAGFKLYFGPNNIKTLASYDVGLDKEIDLGWTFISWINRGVILPIFHLLSSFIGNYGVIILILAVIIKIVLFPLTYKSYLSTAKMQLVNSFPEVKEMEEKYKDDPTKLQQQKLAFTSSAGVSPLAGCLPLLLQMPILFAMLAFFPASIELRQAGFLWAHDLSSYDTVLHFNFNIPFLGDHISGFAVLMTLSQILYTWVSQRGQTMTGPAAQMKFLGYVMPIFFFVVLNNYSAALSYYYLVINIITILQTLAIKATIDEEKLKNQIHEARALRKKNPKKTGGLAGWVEAQQKKQEQALKERRNVRK